MVSAVETFGLSIAGDGGNRIKAQTTLVPAGYHSGSNLEEANGGRDTHGLVATRVPTATAVLKEETSLQGYEAQTATVSSVPGVRGLYHRYEHRRASRRGVVIGMRRSRSRKPAFGISKRAASAEIPASGGGMGLSGQIQPAFRET